MAWIESHQSTARHPKTKRFARLLGVHKVMAIGYLHQLWWWALDYAQNGDLSSYTPDEIADGAEWDGEPDVFLNALVESKYADRIGETIALHDWYDYAGKLLEQREKDAERKRDARAKAKIQNKKDIQGKSGGRPTDIRGTSACTVPNQPDQPTKPNQQNHEEVFAALPELSATSSSNSQFKDMSSSSELDLEFAEVYNLYENERFGQGTLIVKQQLESMIQEFGSEWTKMAITEAVKANKRNLKYVAGILRNWRAEGGPKDGNERGQPKAQNKTPVRDERYSAFYELFPE